jgi:tetratricopeptide (TPR) repeat protein
MRNLQVMLFLLLLPLFANAQTQLSQRDFALLKPAFEAIDEGKLKAAHQQFLKAKKQVRSSYAKALLLSNLGQLELQWQRYSKALPYLSQAYQLKVLPAEQQTGLGHTLAQVHCVKEQWRSCIRYMSQWMPVSAKKVTGQDYLMLAQAHSQLNQWGKVIQPITTAINSRAVAPQSWFQLKVVAHIQLKQWSRAIKAQQRLLKHYAEKGENWRQLVSLQLQVGKHKAALASQRIGYERGILVDAVDYRLLAQMLVQADIPFYAGQVLEQGIKRGALKANKKTLQLLSDCWVKAREAKKAIAVLVRLNRASPSNKSLQQQAHMQMQLRDWRSAEFTLQQLIKRSKTEQPEAQLLLGIVRIKLKRFHKARQALLLAAKSKRQKPVAESWMLYLEQIQPAQMMGMS